MPGFSPSKYFHLYKSDAMITLRLASERGHADFGWLNSRHSFAFGRWRPPETLPHGHGFRTLRVINQDIVGPASKGGGFDPHPHHDMEIISYVIAGAMAHGDSTGTKAIIRPGDIQRMTAGRGIVHSEFNASDDQPVHFLQIWIQPDRRGHEPGYAQTHFPREAKLNQLRLVGAPAQAVIDAGPNPPIALNADARLYASILLAGAEVAVPLGQARHAWVQVIRGRVALDDGTGERVLGAGDAAAISPETPTPSAPAPVAGAGLGAGANAGGGAGGSGMGRTLTVSGRTSAQEESELLVFDLP